MVPCTGTAKSVPCWCGTNLPARSWRTGFARATGQPGVCLVTAQPGISNCVTALGTADSDSVPFLLSSGPIPHRAIGMSRGYCSEMDNLGVPDALTKWNATARSADGIPELARRTFAKMTSGRPSPIRLDLPIDVLAEETTCRLLVGVIAKSPLPICRRLTELPR